MKRLKVAAHSKPPLPPLMTVGFDHAEVSAGNE
jgi:hypothetical protein